MIKIAQVSRNQGEIVLTIEYDLSGSSYFVTINSNEIDARMKQLKDLVGRPLTLQDMKNVVVTMINDIREGKDPRLESFRYEDYIGVDIET